MLHPTFEKEFDGLVEKFAELLTGDATPDTVAKVKLWAVYNHIHKTMPNLAAHWSQTHPEARAEVRRLFEDIRARNEAHRAAGQSAKNPGAPAPASGPASASPARASASVPDGEPAPGKPTSNS